MIWTEALSYRHDAAHLLFLGSTDCVDATVPAKDLIVVVASNQQANNRTFNSYGEQ